MGISVRQAFEEYSEALMKFQNTTIDAWPEDQLKIPVSNLLNSYGTIISHIVETRTEAAFNDRRPDIGVTYEHLLCGYIELKAPSKSINPDDFKTHDKEQWNKFKLIPNILYTNGYDWKLFRLGEEKCSVTLTRKILDKGKNAITAEAVSEMERMLNIFLAWEPIVPGTTESLAKMLAPLCKILRDDVHKALMDENPSIVALERQWHDVLFSNTDNGQFADAYAQTVTYSLLLAKTDGLSIVNPKAAVDQLKGRHKLLSKALEILSDDRAIEVIGIGVELLVRSISAIDINKLPNGENRLWLYFYENFLAEYDSKLRSDRGVFYTPAEVVLAQVNLVADVLEKYFDKKMTFIDDDVTVIDPAVGTGSYPLAIIQKALEKYEGYGQAQVATKLAESIFAFEILVGPYSVAHLRLTQSIMSINGAVLPQEGINVYLTDTLESPNTVVQEGRLYEEPLTSEHIKALGVKRKDLYVCIGNPPYDRENRELEDTGGRRKGGWIRYGDEESSEPPKLNDFVNPVREAGFGRYVKNLYNDYVYFWRWAIWKVIESGSHKKPGIVCFITPSSYLTGVAFMGMRKHMREAFDKIWVIDLEGDNHGPRKTENVFNIQTPVAITLCARYSSEEKRSAEVSYKRLTGTSEQKLERLKQITSISDIDDWQECNTGLTDMFLPIGTSSYFDWAKLTEIFPWHHSGIQTNRSWPIGETKEVLQSRWQKLISSKEESKASLFRETRDRKVTKKYGDVFDKETILTPIISEKNDKCLKIMRYGFRTLDRQWLIFDNRVVDWLRPDLIQSHSDRQIYMVSLLSSTLGEGPGASVSAELPDINFFQGSCGGKDVVPLWKNKNASQANIADGLTEILGKHYETIPTPEDVFAYSYCVLSSREYTKTFYEELAHPGPRIPITKDKELFAKASLCGKVLIHIQTYGKLFKKEGKDSNNQKQRARITKNISVAESEYPESAKYYQDSKELRIGDGIITELAPEVWYYRISGRQVLYSWLSYRMKNAAGKKSSELDKIRPKCWDINMNIDLMDTIKAIENTVAMLDEQDEIVKDIIESQCFCSNDIIHEIASKKETSKAATRKSTRLENDPKIYNAD